MTRNKWCPPSKAWWPTVQGVVVVKELEHRCSMTALGAPANAGSAVGERARTRNREVPDEGDCGDGRGCGNGRDDAGGAARAAGSHKRRSCSESCVGICPV